MKKMAGANRFVSCLWDFFNLRLRVLNICILFLSVLCGQCSAVHVEVGSVCVLYGPLVTAGVIGPVQTWY